MTKTFYSERRTTCKSRQRKKETYKSNEYTRITSL